jgi:chromosome segregation ATPase
VEYLAIVDRFKKDNNEMRKLVAEVKRENDTLKQQLNQITTEKVAWTRVEQSLKERIHKLQEEYYTANNAVAKVVKQNENEEEPTNLESKLDDMQLTLETLE